MVNQLRMPELNSKLCLKQHYDFVKKAKCIIIKIPCVTVAMTKILVLYLCSDEYLLPYQKQKATFFR